jgi:hypothetical protein
MKKVIIPILFLVSCSSKTTDTIYCKRNIKKNIHNIEVLQKWLQEDYVIGDIPLEVAKNYYLVLENTKLGLIKNKRKLKKEIDDSKEY